MKIAVVLEDKTLGGGEKGREQNSLNKKTVPPKKNKKPKAPLVSMGAGLNFKIRDDFHILEIKERKACGFILLSLMSIKETPEQKPAILLGKILSPFYTNVHLK